MKQDNWWYVRYGKRLFDVVVALIACMCFLPAGIVICLLICLESRGCPFFIQERIGKGMRPFYLLKFRSMSGSPKCLDTQFEPGDTRRVTRLGKVLRKTKLDELPQLINVLKGEMSLIGPRPEVPQYVNAYPERFRKILQVRPGFSDYASIKYACEEELLALYVDPEWHYMHIILPDKLELARQYAEHISLRTDLLLMLKTLQSVLSADRKTSNTSHSVPEILIADEMS